ncbi:MAG: hypothetical protein MOB07_28095 [Acidobacteria bacterium]|nr:hypothetical protein [Acidobacteriota bacterium]
MLGTFEKKPRISKLRISYILVILAAVVGLVSYSYHVYALFRDAQQNTPQPQIERLIKDLRRYHSQTRHFPADFTEINQLIWRTKPTPDYDSDGRRARTKNYYYIYTKVNDEICAFWALPIGLRRHYGSSFFIVLSPNWARVWKGKAMGDEEIAKVPAIPLPDALAELSMHESPARAPGENK